MGDGVGRWEGDTLVIETANNNGITWLDTGGNRHSDQLVVTERFTPINNESYSYEATFPFVSLMSLAALCAWPAAAYAQEAADGAPPVLTAAEIDEIRTRAQKVRDETFALLFEAAQKQQ